MEQEELYDAADAIRTFESRLYQKYAEDVYWQLKTAKTNLGLISDWVDAAMAAVNEKSVSGAIEAVGLSSNGTRTSDGFVTLNAESFDPYEMANALRDLDDKWANGCSKAAVVRGNLRIIEEALTNVVETSMDRVSDSVRIFE